MGDTFDENVASIAARDGDDNMTIEDVRMGVLISRACSFPLLLPVGAVEAEDETVRNALTRAVERGYLVTRMDDTGKRVQYDETPEGWKFARSCDYWMAISGEDAEDMRQRGRGLALFYWHNLFLYGTVDMDEFGVGSPWGKDLQVAHLLTCGVVTGGRIPRLTMWEHVDGDGTKETHGAIAYPSCACGKVRSIPLRREMSDDQVSDMLDAFCTL